MGMNRMSHSKFMSVLAGTPKIAGWALSGAAALAVLLPCGAEAETVTLDGSGAMSFSYQFVAPDSTTPTVGDNYGLAVPGQYSFTDTFTTQQSLIQNLPATSPSGSYDFQDSYEFTLGSTANGDTLLASLGLGTLSNMTNLQFRLYEVVGPGMQAVVGGVPAGSTPITPWVGLAPGAESMTASFRSVQAGTYILDVACIASGTNSGSYIGSLAMQTVPLPAGIWLMLSGLGGLGVLSRKRRTA